MREEKVCFFLIERKGKRKERGKNFKKQKKKKNDFCKVGREMGGAKPYGLGGFQKVE